MNYPHHPRDVLPKRSSCPLRSSFYDVFSCMCQAKVKDAFRDRTSDIAFALAVAAFELNSRFVEI